MVAVAWGSWRMGEKLAAKSTKSDSATKNIEVPYDSKADSPTVLYAKPLHFWVFATTAFTLIASLAYLLHRFDKTNVAPQSASPAAIRLASATPEHRSPGSKSDGLSSRTPQPFVDYLRRTIDETPYYRRNARRVNPQKGQNTY